MTSDLFNGFRVFKLYEITMSVIVVSLIGILHLKNNLYLKSGINVCLKMRSSFLLPTKDFVFLSNKLICRLMSLSKVREYTPLKCNLICQIVNHDYNKESENNLFTLQNFILKFLHV